MPACCILFFSTPRDRLTLASVKDLTLVRGRGLLISCAFQSEIFVWDYMRGSVLQRIEHDAQARVFRDAALRVVIGIKQINKIANI